MESLSEFSESGFTTSKVGTLGPSTGVLQGSASRGHPSSTESEVVSCSYGGDAGVPRSVEVRSAQLEAEYQPQLERQTQIPAPHHLRLQHAAAISFGLGSGSGSGIVDPIIDCVDSIHLPNTGVPSQLWQVVNQYEDALQCDPSLFSPPCFGDVNMNMISPAGSLEQAPTAASSNLSNPFNPRSFGDDFFSGEYLLDSGGLQNFSNSLEAGGEPVQWQQDGTLLNSGSGHNDGNGNRTLLWETSRNEAYPCSPWDGTCCPPVLGINRALGQPSASIPLEEPCAAIQHIFAIPANSNEIPATFNQVFGFQNASLVALAPISGVAPQPATASTHTFDGSGLEETHTFPVLQLNASGYRQPPLRIVYDNGLGDDKHFSGRRRPLSPKSRSRIAETRKGKIACVQCRMKKVACIGKSPCNSCSKVFKATLYQQPCQKADFVKIVCNGSSNYFSQRQIDQLTLDGTRRIKKTLPEKFEFKKLLSQVGERRTKFNISAVPNSHSEPLWTLDLSLMFKFLVKLDQDLKSAGQVDFRKFLDELPPSAVGWESSVKGLGAEENILAVLHKWNSMPSRVTFRKDPIITEGFQEPMSIENPWHEEDIFLAAQLSRIVSRALEIKAFEFLQKALNEQKIFRKPDHAKKLIFQLGRVLLQCRWRIAWLGLHEDDGTASNDPTTTKKYVERMQRLTLVLYFYYCSAKSKLPKEISEHGLQGIQSFNSGSAAPILDNFPHANTISGFERWMMQGKDLVRKAEAERSTVKVNPYPEDAVHAVV